MILDANSKTFGFVRLARKSVLRDEATNDLLLVRVVRVSQFGVAMPAGYPSIRIPLPFPISQWLSTILATRGLMSTDESTEWRSHLVEDDEGIRRILRETARVAVVGIKTAETRQPAYYVPEYAQRIGMQIIPVPVYYPEVTEILGETVFRRVADIPGDVDMVNVFRRPGDVSAHVDDILAKRPKSVWLQLGIRNDEAAERLARAGIDVVQDRCLMVELQHHR